MSPFAGVIFLVVCFFAITTHFKAPRIGNVAIENLPESPHFSCLVENTEAVIGLGTDGRYSFSIEGPLFQTTTIQQVAAAQGIIFSEAQLSALNQLDYLDIPIEELPVILNKPSYQQDFHRINQNLGLSETQLLACLMTSKKVVQSLVHKPSYVSLLIDAETNGGSVMHMLEVLQTQGINRFNLKIQGGSRR